MTAGSQPIPPSAVAITASTIQTAPPTTGSSAEPRLIRASGVTAVSMAPFRLAATSAAAESRALDCLTTAVYYEARGEGTDGMAAVAQVILNRVRHPLFPKSVCGVVYQGCQFSFVCGGMNGRRNAALWSRSREIAEAALSGRVMDRVGAATFFHATRINPRWAGLSRVATVGRHVFYAYAGHRGRPSQFLDVVNAGAAPSTAPAASTRAEPPVYAMLPNTPVETPVASAEAAMPADATATLTPAPTAPVNSAPMPLPNAPLATPDPLHTPSPVA